MKEKDLTRLILAAQGKCQPITPYLKCRQGIIRAWGMNPEQILTKDAFSQPARTYVAKEERQNKELEILSATLRDLIRQEANTQKKCNFALKVAGPTGVEPATLGLKVRCSSPD